MKKGLALFLTLALLLGMASLASAQDKVITPKVVGEAVVGYIYLPDYQKSDFALYNEKYGAFYANLRWFQFRLITDINLSRDFTLGLVSQFEVTTGEANPLQNLTLTYDPGFAKITFAGKGQEVALGIKDQELLKLNVDRRIGSGEPDCYKTGSKWAKQLTTEVFFDWIRAAAVFSLEGSAERYWDFVGGLAEFELGDGIFGFGYQNKMTDEIYDSPVPEGYIVLTADYRFTPNLRLQVDYSSNDNGGKGYTGYIRPVDFIESYPGTPFKIKNHINSISTIYDAKVNARFLNTMDNKWKYWLDGSYYFKPFTVGVNYRNWGTDDEPKAKDDGYVAEFYAKHDLTDSWRDYLKAFYRTDGWFGAVIVISLY